jgi:hypothetical protein
MADADVMPMPQRRAMPEMVELDPAAGMPPHSPAEMSLLREMTGKPLAELVGEEGDDGDKEAVLIWFTLRRLGYEPTWEEARNQLVSYVTPTPPSGGDSTTSPPSAASGA